MLALTRDYAGLDDLALAALIARRDPAAVRLVTGRNNQRLYRVAWSILKNRAEAEDAVQEGYLRAFRAIEGFTGAASLSTWLTRIVANEALGRRRAAQRRARVLSDPSVLALDEYREKLMAGSSHPPPGDLALIRAEAARMLQAAVARLPDLLRPVFVLRDIEELSIAETAEALGVSAQTVKNRLLRARRCLQQDLGPELRSALDEATRFAGADCEALTKRVVAALTARP